MFMVVKDIETGVDKLVSLVSSKKKIELEEAANELGVSQDVVREWGEFLEEEGTLTIEYSLSKVFFVEKRLSRGEVATKVKEYGSKKDAFVRKVETTLQTLSKETEEFEAIKEHFADLKHKIGSEMDVVKQELDELKHYEDLKQNIDNDIQKQRDEYLNLMQKARAEIRKEEDKYTEILERIGNERERIIIEKKGVLRIEEQEDHLRKRLEAISGIVKSIQSKVDGQKASIELSEKQLQKLEELANHVEENIKDKRESVIEPLIKKSEEQTNRIAQVQEAIIAKVKKKESAIAKYSEESRKLSDKFKLFFDKKIRIEQLMNKIEDEKRQMEEQLKELIKKAKTFSLVANKTDVKKYVEDLQNRFNQVEERKDLLRKKVERLTQIIRGN